jgi:nucleotide-binding universal stress UspA family protein
MLPGALRLPYRRVAVAVDGSDRALDALGPALRLARLHDAALQVVTVARPGDRAGAEAILATAARRAGDVTVEATVLEGEDPAATLGRFDDEHPETLLCLTTRVQRPIARAVLGSVAAGVVAHSTQVVALVGPRCDLGGDAPIDQMVVSLDGSDEAEAILPWAEAWSGAISLPITLVHVVYPLVPPEAAVAPTAAQMDELRYLRRVAREMQADGHAVRDLVVQHPDPPGAIIDVVEGLPRSVVAAASTDRHPFTEVIVRSTTATVLRASTAPVLVASRPRP